MAAGLATELRESFQVAPTLVVGTQGIFDVKVDEELVFSKFVAKRFPFLGEITQILKNRPPKGT